jgi:hypothetical protein
MAEEWVQINTYTYTGPDDSSGTVNTTLYYDKASINAESVKIKFTGSGRNWNNGYYIILNPTSDNYKLGAIKYSKAAGGGYTECIFTVSKAYSDKNFKVPFWLCNVGNVKVNIANRTVGYYYPADSTTIVTYDIRNIFKAGGTTTNNRHPYKTDFSSTTASISEAEAKALSESDGSYVQIQSKDDNSFSIRAQGVPTQVASGKNNPVKSAKLTCTGLTGAINCSTEVTRIVYLPSNTTGDGYGVTAEVVTDATYGPDVRVNAAVLIPNYIAPTKPTNVQLANSSFKNGRLTTKQPWTFTWNPAEANNDYSPVAGYSFRLYKNGEAVDRIFCSGNELILDANGQDIASRDLTAYSTCELVIDPVLLGFEPKDTVQLGVQAYARNGLGKTTWSLNNNTCKYSLYSGDTDVHVVGENETKSTEYEVENAGVVKVKTPDHGWVEGQVWVKDASGWCEAETVLVKTSDGWMESQ